MVLRAVLALIAMLVFAAPAQAQDAAQDEPITIGTSHRVFYNGVERRVNVVVPRAYDEGETAYPLVVVLDGGLDQDFFLTLGLYRWNRLWQRSAPAIFVGVETVDRQRELLPPTNGPEEIERYPTAGESAAFRAWLANDVLPMLRSNYRDDGRAFLIGESAAGHFVLETWVQTPGLFHGYGAISPSLQWSDQHLARNFVAAEYRPRPPLYISLADEGGATEEGVLRVVGNLEGERCFSDRRDELVHANALHGLLPEALQYLLPTEADWLDEFGLTLRCDTD